LQRSRPEQGQTSLNRCQTSGRRLLLAEKTPETGITTDISPAPALRGSCKTHRQQYSSRWFAAGLSISPPCPAFHSATPETVAAIGKPTRWRYQNRDGPGVSRHLPWIERTPASGSVRRDQAPTPVCPGEKTGYRIQAQ